MRVHIIDNGEGFDVHAAACLDVRRSRRYWQYRAEMTRGAGAVEVSSLRDVVEYMYGPDAGSFYEESGHAPDDPEAWRDYVDSFQVKPCVRFDTGVE